MVTDGEMKLEATLARVARRLRASVVLGSVGAGLVASAFVTLVLSYERAVIAVPAAVGLALTVICVLTLRHRRTWTPRAAATAIERVRPDSRNLIVTAEELLRHPERARSWVRTRVLTDAAAMTRVTDIASAVPLRRETILAVVGLAALGLVIVGAPQRAASAVRQTIQQASGADTKRESGVTRVTATLVPPPYLAITERTIEDPDRLEAVAGSRLKLSLTGPASLRVRFGTKPLPISSAPSGILHGELLLAESGYLAIDNRSGDASARRLIAVVVTPDRSPVIRIDQPGKDLLVPDSRPTIGIRTSASDDFGLRALELRYTKVSGSGERFEFEEGTVPLDVARHTEREWQGQAAIALSGLNLQPGDSVVYRVVGRDGRSGDAGSSSSDTYFIEVAGPGQITLAGFELPPERERYALSQQMVVLKIQRLRTTEQSMSRPALSEGAASIAAEQRAVRANFIFLTGGQVEDEEQEAEHSHEIQEGRLENTARREIGVAIQHMSRADQALVAVDTTAALAAARAAVEALQRAFGRNRYILRTLPVRSRIDPSRRLSGNLDEARDATRETYSATPEPAALVSRRLLAKLVEIGPALTSDGDTRSADLTSLAEDALSVDSASETWQRIARGLLSLRDRGTAGRRDDAQAKLNEVIGLLLTEARKSAVSTPAGDETDRALRSAWVAERHRQ